MKQIFKDSEMQAQFERDGFITFDLLTEGEVKHLRDFYAALAEAEVPSYGFHVSLDHSNREQVKAVTEELYKVLEPKAAEIFENHKIFTSSFVVKEHNPKGVVPPHQDWTFVDESEYWSATLWTPLMDVHMDNGALGVIKGSHKFFDWPRCSPSPQFKTPLGEHMFTIFPYLEVIPLKAGQAIMFDNRTIHGSPPNTTEETRLAVGIGVTHKDADLFHHYLLPGEGPAHIEQYAIQREFFLTYNNGNLSKLHDEGGKPEGWALAKNYPLDLPKFSAEEMQEKMKSYPGNGINGPLIEKMARLFNYNMDGTKKEEAESSAQKDSRTGSDSDSNSGSESGDGLGAGSGVGAVANAPAPKKKGFFQRLFGRK